MPFFIIMGIVINLKKNIYNLMVTQFTAYSLQLISTTFDILPMCIGNDVEDDIIFYDVYFDVNSAPVLHASDLAASELNQLVTSNTIYYWKVITKDEQGNSIDSGVYQFKVE